MGGTLIKKIERSHCFTHGYTGQQDNIVIKHPTQYLYFRTAHLFKTPWGISKTASNYDSVHLINEIGKESHIRFIKKSALKGKKTE